MPDSEKITLIPTYKKHLFKDFFLFGFSGFLALGKPIVTHERIHVLPENSYIKIWKDSYSDWFQILTLASSVISGTQSAPADAQVIQESEGLKVLCIFCESKISLETSKTDNVIKFDMDLYNCVQLLIGFQEGLLSPFACSPLTILRLPTFLSAFEAENLNLANPDLVISQLSKLFPQASSMAIYDFALDINAYKKEIEITFNIKKFLNTSNLINFL